VAYLRLRQICLVAQTLEPYITDFADILGLAVCYRDGNVDKYGLVNALLPIGASFLEIVAPTTDGTAAGRYLERRGGDGGYMVILDCDDIERRRQRMATIGVRIDNPLRYASYNRAAAASARHRRLHARIQSHRGRRKPRRALSPGGAGLAGGSARRCHRGIARGRDAEPGSVGAGGALE
jgi:hypothetical protein